MIYKLTSIFNYVYIIKKNDYVDLNINYTKIISIIQTLPVNKPCTCLTHFLISPSPCNTFRDLMHKLFKRKKNYCCLSILLYGISECVNYTWVSAFPYYLTLREISDICIRRILMLKYRYPFNKGI